MDQFSATLLFIINKIKTNILRTIKKNVVFSF